MAQTYRLRIVSWQGRVLAEVDRPSVEGLMRAADEHEHRAASATIRGEFTSDGTHWGVGSGRVEAARDGGQRWLRYTHATKEVQS